MAVLHINHRPNKEGIIPLGVDPIMIGRNLDCEVCILIPGPSMRHARIIRVNDTTFIEDNHTRNGTFVNGVRIGSPTELKHGDQIRIADFIVYFLDAPCFSNASQQVVFDLRWRTPTVLSLDAAVSRQQPPLLSEVDGVTLAVLADALEEAGCTELAILEHLRWPGPHVGACWALCLILGSGWAGKPWSGTQRLVCG
jgi:pSer/pThr/pTyr-binding forkhead associated (FHA) protein